MNTRQVLIMSKLEWFGAGILLILLGTLMAPLSGQPLRMGMAAVKITPDVGVPMAGYYHERGAEGTLDDLFAKAVVFDDGASRAALVTLDLISVTKEVTTAARSRVEELTGIQANGLMICATHAHTGPELASRGSRSQPIGGSNPKVVRYTEQLPGLIAQAVEDAVANLQSVQIEVAQGVCEGLTFNRRFFMRDGTVGWNPGKLNPEINLEAGKTDPAVGILVAYKSTEKDPSNILSTLVNFAMHPDTVGGARYSADWPGALARILSSYHGSGHHTQVTNGTSGNLNHLDVRWAMAQKGTEEAHRIGVLLGAEVLRAYKDLQPVAARQLRTASRSVLLPIPEVSEAEVEQARRDVATATDQNRVDFMRLVKGHQLLDVAAREGRPIEVEVQVITLGNEIAWVALPGEVFVELGLAIKLRSPFRYTFPVSLANENIGYIPDRRSYAEGNYEPVSARCAAGSGELLVDAAVDLLAELAEQ
ncbi:MAG: neutral/alkaline non-lysosomal ceramidase N-terminal domain-containing protein [Acidobacteriota bacterium]|nr:MAG: neutral/alkaline non-lysosomal ceramidase N-terminal domain-containing protein [Acidobacteriota bacterium]